MMNKQDEQLVGAEGVLLYYYFTQLSTRQVEEQEWYINSCSQLNLVGRVRIARDGVNCTLGGNYESLQQHASQVAERYSTSSIDFKLTKSVGRKNEQCAAESKFTQLTVDVVKEVVTIGLDDLIEADGDVTAAPVTVKHVSPTKFHQLLQNARRSINTDNSNSDKININKETVLVDCRNLYETRIGQFEAEGVTTLDPGTRAFSDLPAWFESNAHKLAGKRVLMCCTGGVRCERAAAYLLTLGRCFQGEDDVVQLHGGIERYLEQFGQDGYFKGKNFVFDERGDVEGGAAVAVKEDKKIENSSAACSVSKTAVRGTCCVCSAPWGDYGARARCSACRMLVLLCDTCCCEKQNQKEGADYVYGNGNYLNKNDHKRTMLCELCQQRYAADISPTVNTLPPPTRARILCLHGFRQTSRNFQGRTSALRRRLKNVAEFVFVDAPHALPDIYGRNNNNGEREKTRVIKDQGGEDEDVEKLKFNTAPSPTENNDNPSSPSSLSTSQSAHQKRHRRAWLLTPEQYTNPDSIPESDELTHEQYQCQTAGLEESLKVLDGVLDTQGPWDGILGFSQGASIAALLAARECKDRSNNTEERKRRFKFVICCSGYKSPLHKPEKEEEEANEENKISMPSLHLYGTNKQDRQISEPESKSLREQFDPTQRVLLRHNAGHVIPSTRLAAARIADFIEWVKGEEKE
jgi:predicted sulfurtransferase